MTELPLLPLKTVLLPGNKLSLKIFEPRYLDMIAQCMREDSRFGVVLIHKGDETSSNADIYSVGTTTSIDDWQNRADGLLGITVLGVERFEVLKTHTQSDGLTVADVQILHEPQVPQTPEQFSYMQELLNHISAQEISAQEGKSQTEQASFNAITYQLVFLLPLDTTLKQRLLEIPDCNDRAVILHAELIRLGVIQHVKPDQHPG
ncbi:MAG: peptidase S16 [Gammaproteobacteria bacterium]|nr:peptidase S16 [Gammaproteobacteria bacterium]